MTVSFIVTSYNYAKYTEETISSIKNQTYKDFEIIVVDDASKDSSVAILENISNIKLIKHDTNKALLASLISYAVHVIMALIKSKLISSLEIYDFDDAFFETFEKKFGDIDEDDDDHDE